MPTEGLEPPTNGLQITHLAISLLITQSLAALATPHSSLIQSHFGHSQSESGHKLVTRPTSRIGPRTQVLAVALSLRLSRAAARQRTAQSAHPVPPSLRGLTRMPISESISWKHGVSAGALVLH